MPSPLTVATPVLAKKDQSPAVDGELLSKPEEPVTVKVGPVLQNGKALGPAELKAFVCCAVRIKAAGAAEEVWDKKANAWAARSAVTAENRETIGLSHKPDQAAAPWQGQLTLMGAKGKFDPAADGYPRYAVRASFTTAKGVVGESALSPAVQLPTPGDDKLAGIKIAPDPETAKRLELFVRPSPGSAYAGSVIIDQEAGTVQVTCTGGATVTLKSDNSLLLQAGGASVVLAGGHITLTPAAGGKVKINGAWEHPEP